MRKLKRILAIMVMAMVMSLGAPQAFAGFIPMGVTGPTETPGVAGDMSTGITGDMGTPGVCGDISCPGVNGEMSTPGFYGWMGTGLAAIASLFS